MLSGPSLPSLPLPSLLQYLLLVSYRAEDKVMNYHRDNMIAVLFQLLVLGNFVSVDELEGAARTLHEEFHRLTETEVTQKIVHNPNSKNIPKLRKILQVAVAYSALRHLNPEVVKGLGARIHQTFGFRL